MDNIQRRSLQGQIRSVSDDNGSKVIEGVSLVYNTLSDFRNPSPRGLFYEKIDPGAFVDSIKGDVGCYYDHKHLLGRTSSGTLQLSNDEHGLRFRCTLPDTTYANDLVVSLERGDVYGCSFGFAEAVYDWSQDQDGNLVGTVVRARLFDVGPVNQPVYDSSSVDLRSLDAFLAKSKQHLDEAAQTAWFELASRRLKYQSQKLND